MLHITVFHMSRPDDPRPSPMSAYDDAMTAVPITERRGPTPEEISQELAAVTSIVQQMQPLEHLEVSSTLSMKLHWQKTSSVGDQRLPALKDTLRHVSVCAVACMVNGGVAAHFCR